MFSVSARTTVLLCVFLVEMTAAQEPLRSNPAALYTTLLPESYVLSELPLTALLKVKKSVNNIICSGFIQRDYPDACPTTSHPPVNASQPEESASSRTLSDIKDFFSGGSHSEKHPGPSPHELVDHRKTYYDHHVSWKGEESGKIQKLFQFSVTALAFLAFGGYLLCMIVQAIKSKGTVYYNPYLSGAQAIKKKKPIFSYGRRRRRRSSPVPPHSTVGQSSDLDAMYNGLISAIDTYVHLYSPV